MNKVPPNGVYGFRTPTTLSNSIIWYQVNAYGARLLLETGLLVIIISSLFSLSSKISDVLYMGICMMIMLGGVFLSAVLSLQYQSHLIGQSYAPAPMPLPNNGMPSPLITAFLYIAINISMVTISLPMARKQVAPNPWYGFRTKQTLSNPDVWYAANAYSGRLMIKGSIINIALIVLMFNCVPDPFIYLMLCSLSLITGLMITTGKSMNYMKKII
jgi:uncharacterized membrane protein